jgi:hypothetical protein
MSVTLEIIFTCTLLFLVIGAPILLAIRKVKSSEIVPELEKANDDPNGFRGFLQDIDIVFRIPYVL